jgi:hypothetical protein
MSQLAQSILAYLTERQDAQDTLEGIAEWWLLEQKISSRTAEVREALSELVASELIVERKTGDAQTYYRLNRRKVDAIAVALKQSDG